MQGFALACGFFLQPVLFIVNVVDGRLAQGKGAIETLALFVVGVVLQTLPELLQVLDPGSVQIVVGQPGQGFDLLADIVDLLLDAGFLLLLGAHGVELVLADTPHTFVLALAGFDYPLQHIL